MKAPENWTEVIEGKRYSTKTATLLAGDDYWDGNNFERGGTNQFLYRTPRGAYFLVTLTQWQGSRNMLEVIKDPEQARNMFEGLPEKRVSYEEAFPDFKIEDA